MNPPAIDTRNLNALWASVVAETLVRSGVVRAVVSPGSRSTPLAFAFARHPALEAVPILDERSAGFFALGAAKRDLRPTVLLCTSGSAGAHYLPAIIEAHESGVPLVVITADRPPEMRGCASGQTIDQHRLYGTYAGLYHELAVPEVSLDRLRYLRQTIAHAVERSLAPFAGPVHLNAPFRDPLPPIDDGGAAQALASKVVWEDFFSHLRPPAPVATESEIPSFPIAVHGLLVAGPALVADAAAHARAVGEAARRLGWPILADGLSPLRNHRSAVPHLVTRYDAVLRVSSAAESLRPEFVVCLGEWPTSKILRTWIEASGAPVLQVTRRHGNRDALHGSTRRVVASLESFAAALPVAEGTNGYERLWASYESRAAAALDARLAPEDDLVEPKAAWLMAAHLPEGSLLSVANSMPVRDMEYVWPGNDRGIRVFSSRGANGIDGTLSTALGVAQGGPPAALLTGDLAFLHDSNGLLISPRFKGSLTVILVNNHGGGIFEHLPVAQFGSIYEDYFATPQEVDFSKLCAAHGVAHEHVEDWPHFKTLLARPPTQGIRVLEITTDRRRDSAWRKDTFAALAR